MLPKDRNNPGIKFCVLVKKRVRAAGKKMGAEATKSRAPAFAKAMADRAGHRAKKQKTKVTRQKMGAPAVGALRLQRLSAGESLHQPHSFTDEDALRR